MASQATCEKNGLKLAVISLEEEREWKAALSGFAVPAQFHHEYLQALSYSHKDPIFLFVMEGEKGKAAVVFAEREAKGVLDIYTPYGFGGFAVTGEVPGFAKEFRDFMHANGAVCGYIMQNPLFGAPWVAEGQEAFPHHVIYALDLRQGRDALFAAMHNSHQYEIRKWESEGNKIITDKARIAKALPGLYAAAMEEKGASDVYKLSAKSLKALLAWEGAFATGVEEGEKITAVTVFLRSGDYGEYFINASTPEARRHSRGLIWHLLGDLKEAGVCRVNLGGGVKPGDGLDDFKRRFGGEPLPVIAYKQVYDKARFDSLSAGFEKNGYFPPYR